MLRANQVWAPRHGNDPEAARRLMRRFYELVAASANPSLDPNRVAELDVEWWRVHREHQYDEGSTNEALIVALRDLYAYCYEVEPEDVRPAASLRAEAMDLSDRWVRAGRDPADPALASVRVLLVRSHAALLAAVHR